MTVRRRRAGGAVSAALLAFVPAACKNTIQGTSAQPPAGEVPATPHPSQPRVVVSAVPSPARSPPAVARSSDVYVRPMIAHREDFSNDQSWCACRDSCGVCRSNPHIGQDFNSNQVPETSIAVGEGVVKAIEYEGGCGYSVLLQDETGAVWRYLHLNKPTVAHGQRVGVADVLGINRDYPQGCGSGAHLHLERHSKGGWPGEERARTCAKGRRNCRFDPWTPLKGKRKIASEAERKSLASTYKAVGASESMSLTGVSEVANTARPVACSSLQAAPARLSADESSLIADAPTLSAQAAIGADFSVTPASGGRARLALARLTLLEGDESNGTNDCGVLDERECVVTWSLAARSRKSKWWRLFTQHASRGRPVMLPAEASLCVPPDSDGAYAVTVTTNRGRTLRARLRLP